MLRQVTCQWAASSLHLSETRRA